MHGQQSYGQQPQQSPPSFQQQPFHQPQQPQHGYGQPMHYYGGPPTATKHSGLGVISFVMSIASGLLIFGLFVVIVVMEARSPGVIDDKDSPATMALGVAFIGLLGVSAVAFVLGLVSFTQRDRKHLFAILGICFSALTVVGLVGLMIIGLMVG